MVLETKTSVRRRNKVLTVGDGDLSLSLALSRAYGDDHIDLTASVLEPDGSTLRSVFPEAPLENLHDRGVSVLYGVDATQLHSRFASRKEGENDRENDTHTKTTTTKMWDLVSFHHPHLGTSNLEDCEESERAELHHRLLCHYLRSAGKVSKLVHVCLMGTQPETWKLSEAAKLQNLRLVKTLPDSKPFSNVWTEHDNNNNNNNNGCGDHPGLPEPARVEARFAAPRKYRNGKLGRHFLARYGYRHRRTEGVHFRGSTKDANVSESMHFVFADNNNNNNDNITIDEPVNDLQNGGTHREVDSDSPTSCTINEERACFVCPICRASFDSDRALKDHLVSPISLPTIPEAAKARTDPDTHKNSLSSSSSTKQSLHPKSAPLDEPSGQIMLLQQRYDERLGTILTVPSIHEGRRLRWFLQHAKLKNIQYTKRLAESAIQAGLVSVNGQAALDSSRILHDGDTLTIRETTKRGETERTGAELPKPPACKTPSVEIVERSPSTSSMAWLVALKPSGMRTKGNFPGTLEYIVSEQEKEHGGPPYYSLSTLETSCSGLCVLVQTNGISKGMPSGSSTFGSGKARISVMHFLTVLVHGRLTRETWPAPQRVSLVLEAKWRQKKKNNKKRKHALGSLSETHQPEEEARDEKCEKVVSATIEFRESFAASSSSSSSSSEKNSPSAACSPAGALSTLLVGTSEPSSGSICHYFRQEGFPVVGDTFCKQEYSKLKRSVRNRIKNKLCMGCYKVCVSITDEETNTTTKHEIEIQSPNKLSASFWEKFLSEERPALKAMEQT